MNDRPNPRPKGFTLIELLIVVAIIAILAAIAVPNFLEAQTRSKVSRTYSDMRSMATALESYMVDHNHYPPDITWWGDDANLRTYLYRLQRLTTPISYITTIPEDVFAEGAMGLAENSTIVPPNPYPLTAGYKMPFDTGDFVRPYPFDYAYRDDHDPLTGLPEDLAVWAEITQNPENIRWAMRAIGPDMHATWLGIVGATVYDPTNGTVSEGDIYFNGPGLGIDGPQ